MNGTSPNAACPGLLWKPLDVGIGQLLAPYRPSGCQGNRHKDGHFDGHGNALVRNHAHCLMEEVQSFTRSHWTLPSGKYYAQYHGADMAMMFFFDVFIVKTIGKGHGLMHRTLFLIGI
jgi:hypothetical protein